MSTTSEPWDEVTARRLAKELGLARSDVDLAEYERSELAIEIADSLRPGATPAGPEYVKAYDHLVARALAAHDAEEAAHLRLINYDAKRGRA